MRKSKGKSIHNMLARIAMHNWGKWYRSDEPVWPNVITRARAGYYPAYRPVLSWEFRPIADEALEGRRVWLEVRYIGRPLEGHAPWDESADELAPLEDGD